MDGMLTKTSDFNDVIVYNFLVAATGVNFVLCYYADKLTEEASEVGDAMYSTAWYEMPIPQQKMLMLPIYRSQKLIQLTGFGIYTYSLKNFGRILLRSQASRLIIFSLTGKNPQLMVYDRVWLKSETTKENHRSILNKFVFMQALLHVMKYVE